MNQPMQGSTQDYCDRFQGEGDHHWVSHTKGGEPLWVRICSLCNYIDWDGLREQVERIRKENGLQQFLNHKWRVDSKLGRTIYAIVDVPGPDNCDVVLGMVDTRELAEHIVEIHNDKIETKEALEEYNKTWGIKE